MRKDRAARTRALEQALYLVRGGVELDAGDVLRFAEYIHSGRRGAPLPEVRPTVVVLQASLSEATADMIRQVWAAVLDELVRVRREGER